jgi:exopolysaccharide biosynthesis polyprenyl glycosylphosphotransferase
LSKRIEYILLFISDFFFINTAWVIYYMVRVESGWIPVSSPTSVILPSIAIYFYWLIVFVFAGLYQYWFARSRFDEFSSALKAISIGCFILFFVIFLDDAISNAQATSRFLILIYWTLMVVCVGFGRVLIRSIQMSMLQKGIGLRQTLIIGTGERGLELNSLISRYPQLGYKVTGFISTNGAIAIKYETVGKISNLAEIIEKNNIKEILIALEKNEKEKLLDIIGNCPQDKVNLKILPDTYEIVSGMVKTNQLYGVPLIEVTPEIMPYGARLTKRVIDIMVSLFLIAFFSPFWIIITFLIKMTSTGSVFYVQRRVSRGGKIFRMYKFRTMHKDAEEYGPEWAGEKDPRITKIGKIIRKLYIDEIPQLYNVLRNEMSLVGPRPERPHFVEILKKEIPYYYKRMAVKPGITGWAQVKHKYDSSFDDVKEKLQYDFYYIENMSLKLDFKIMINTILVVILMKGH